MGTKCRRCSECRDYRHHWIADVRDEEDDDYLPGYYACKHCDARGDECVPCEGGGTSSGKEGPNEPLCELCGGDGIEAIDDQQLVQAMKEWLRNRASLN